MKKIGLLVIVALLLTGCAAEETFETVADVYAQPAAAIQRQIQLALPSEAVMPSMENDNADKLYICDGYTLTLQTMESGDLEKTILEVSGFSREDLTVMETAQEDYTRYEFVWASAGEGGDTLSRAAILDDGDYHYVLCCTACAEDAGGLTEVWNSLFDSFELI